MDSYHASVKLRPTRIGFLVNPRDMASVKRIMKICTCLWGGSLNPIIPVFQRPPKDWRYEQSENVRGYGIARGYIKFFEPDVYVEAEQGMLEKLGLENLRERTIDTHIVGLGEFFTSDMRSFHDVSFGLSVLEVLRHKFKVERKFQLKHDSKSILVPANRSNGASEVIFGCYPNDETLQYLQQGYKDVFEPDVIASPIEGWREVFENGANTPLKTTREGISLDRTWNDDVVLYFFDPRKSTDLIDLWNMRLEPSPLIPVPISWANELSDTLSKIIVSENRPVRGNPSGIMHHATVEFSRSVGEEYADSMLEDLFESPCRKLLSVKHWRNSVWRKKQENGGPNFERMTYTYNEHSSKLNVDEEGHTEIEPLSPEFADQYGGHYARWVNVISIGTYGHSQWATILPFNTFSRGWPNISHFDRFSISTEGWAFPQKYKNMSKSIQLTTGDIAIISWLETKNIKAQLSEPGRIAKQIIACLGGLWDLHVLKNPETLKLLNTMARPIRRRSNNLEIVEETFSDRSCDIKKWIDHASRRREQNSMPRISVDDFTKRNVLRIGIETICTHCQQANWKGLDAIDYSVNCERCLNSYSFPQSNLQKNNKNWKYRVIGPFSIHDYSRGSYAALLTIKTLNDIRFGRDSITYSTALDLKFDGQKAEVDFAAWLGPDSAWWAPKYPEFFIGEAKSFAGEAIKKKDIDQLKLVAKKLPSAGLIISVLKEEYSTKEKRLLLGLGSGPINFWDSFFV